MSNNTVWNTPDQQATKQGDTNVGVVYVVDPSSGKIAAPSSFTSVTNDGSFFQEATHKVAVAQGHTADTVIKSSAGFLFRLLVTATGSANTLIYDNATTHSGDVIAILKSTAAVGDIVEAKALAPTGITVAGSATNAGFTAFYS